MSLYGNSTENTSGALRNAQLLPIYFPGWTLHFYVPTQAQAQQKHVIPLNILKKLNRAGAKTIEVSPPTVTFPPELYSWLALDDIKLDYVLIRNVTSRLSDRDKKVVQEWMNTQTIFHCIRDHPAFVNVSIIPGAFGAKPNPLSNILKQPVFDILNNSTPSSNHYIFQLRVLENAIWPRVKNYSLCHDSVSCNKWPNTLKFSIKRQKIKKLQTPKETEFIPAAFNEHHRIAYNITYDNEHWWRSFYLQNPGVANQCQIR